MLDLLALKHTMKEMDLWERCKNRGKYHVLSYLLLVTASTKPKTIVEVVPCLAATILSTDASGDILHADNNDIVRYAWKYQDVQRAVSKHYDLFGVAPASICSHQIQQQSGEVNE